MSRMKVKIDARDLSDKARRVWNSTDPKEAWFGECKTLEEIEETALSIYDEVFGEEEEVDE